MPVYGKDRNTWRVVIHWRGQRKDFIVRGTKRDALAAEARARVELEAHGPAMIHAVPRLAEFSISQYEPFARMHLKAGTWAKDRGRVAMLRERLGHLRLCDVTPEVIDGYKRERASEGRRPATINAELRILRRMLTWARDARGIPMPPVRVQLLSVRGHKRRGAFAWSAEEAGRLMAAAREVSARVTGFDRLLTFALHTGVRQGEAVALRWRDIDTARGLVLVWPNEEWQPKNNKPREVPYGEALLPVLEGERADPDWVFPSTRGGRYALWPRKPWGRARKIAGVAGTVHTIRHTFASHFLANVPDLYLLARILGHSDATVTRLYAHMLPDHLERARGAVSFETLPTTLPDDPEGGGDARTIH